MSSGSLAEVESLAIQNSKTVSRRSGRGRLREVVVYDRFQYKALTEDIFGDLGRWLPARGGRTWRFDCIIILKLCLPRGHIADILHRGLTTTQAVCYFHSNRSRGSLFTLASKTYKQFGKFVSNSTADLRIDRTIHEVCISFQISRMFLGLSASKIHAQKNYFLLNFSNNTLIVFLHGQQITIGGSNFLDGCKNNCVVGK